VIDEIRICRRFYADYGLGEKMNIIYYVDEFPPFFRGGLGIYATGITKEFAKLGHNITIFSKNLGDSPTRELMRGIDVHRPLLADVTDIFRVMIPKDIKKCLPESQKVFAETFLYNILSYSKLNHLIRRDGKEVDIIAAHDWLAAPAGIISKKSLKKPFVFHVHSTEHGRGKDPSPTIEEIESKAGRKADLIITVSYAMRDELVSLGQEKKKIRVVYNGVDPEIYNSERFSKKEIKCFRKKLGVKEDELMILFIGRLTWAKGADSLIHAMPLILGEAPKAKLVMLGRGEQKNVIKRLITSLGIQKNVMLKSRYVSDEKKMLYHAACDIAVFPSKYEPFGIVCTEAMCMEKPVVVGARGISGLREQVIPSGPEKCGLYVNPYSPKDIAKSVVELLEDKDLREELGKNARKRVLKNFTWEKTARETLKVYEEAITASREEWS
jgi:glycosyltransferase involved in cell wall biosynthesis